MASAGLNHWEVVGKTKKGTKGSGHDVRKSQKKILAENMPRIETAPPVKESSTIYDAFRDKPSRVEKPSGKEQVKPAEVTTNGRKPVQRKKHVAPEKKEPKVSLETAAAKIDPVELETMLTKDQATFPESPSVWLKDLASVLNLRLDNIPEPDPVFEGKPTDYPVCTLGKPVRQLLLRTLSLCSTETLKLFYEHCMQSMINDMGKGTSTYGYRMFMQLIAQDKPELVLANLKKSLDIIHSHQNRPLRCLSIMWAVGQAGNTSLANGLVVWLEVMLPVLNVRAFAAYSVRYLDQLFSQHKPDAEASQVMSFRRFFPILDLIFKPNSSLSTLLQQNLQQLYPSIKSLSFGKEQSMQLRNFFPSFLARAEPKNNGPLKAEVLSCLVHCLTVDSHCFSLWRDMYTRHLTQSSALLQHLEKVIDKSSMDRRMLRDTIRAFHITNKELAAEGKGSGNGYNQCVSSCKVLLDKLSGMRFPWRFFLFLLLAAAGGLLALDIHSSNGFPRSRTNKFLEDTGILVFLTQAGHRIKGESTKAYNWLETNVPLYYARTCEVCGPYLVLACDKMHAAGVWLVETLQPARDWVVRTTPLVIAWFQEKVPTLWDGMCHYTREAWHFTVETSIWLWHHTVQGTEATAEWLRVNVFTGKLSPDNLHKTFIWTVSTVQNASSIALARCSEFWYGSPTE